MKCLFCETQLPDETLFCSGCEAARSASIVSDDSHQSREGQLLKSVINDRYELLGQIWKSSLGIDFRALFRMKGRIDCIHVLPFNLSSSERNVLTFHDAVKSWSSHKIRYLLRPIVSGRQAKLHFAVTVNPPGIRLTELLQEDHDISVNLALKLFIRIARILGACHRAGLLHGNIKPSSCFVSREGIVYLGFMALLNPMPAELFSEMVASDISLYAAPEQLRQEPATIQTDLYSLALVGYQLFTGVNPFQTDKEINILYKNLHESVIPPLALNADIPPPLSDIITKNLSKNPFDRSQSVAEILTVVESLERRAIIPETPAPLNSTDQKNLKQLINDGREHYQRGRFQKALDCWNSYLRYDPSNYAVQRFRDFAMQRMKLLPERSS